MTTPPPKPPSIRPALGLSVPVELVRVRDGDTVEVRLHGSGMVWALRLIDTWCKELKRGTDADRRLGYQAKQYASEVLSAADVGTLSVFVPFPQRADGVAGLNLLSLVTFDRIPAYLYVGSSRTLNRMLVERGLASTTRDGELGT